MTGRRVIAGMLVGATLASCRGPATSPPPTEATGTPSAEIVAEPRVSPSSALRAYRPDCDDEAMCAAGIRVDDRFFYFDCWSVRPELVGRELVAPPDSEFGSIRAIEGLDPADAVAAERFAPGDCDPIKVFDGTLALTFEFRDSLTPDQYFELLCTFVVLPDPSECIAP